MKDWIEKKNYKMALPMGIISIDHFIEVMRHGVKASSHWNKFAI